MKRVILLCLAAMGALLGACDSDRDHRGDWAREPEVAMKARVFPVSFELNGEFYVGLGLGDDDEELSDFWKTSDGESWTQVTTDSFPGDPRQGAMAFVVDGKAYVGCGFQDNRGPNAPLKDIYYKDFYSFDGTTWTKIADFPGEARYRGLGFAIKGVGYVGSGYTVDRENVNTYYSFTPASGWSTSAINLGDSRQGGTVFVIDDVAYICLGISGAQSTDYVRSMISFDGQTVDDDWPALANVHHEDFDNDYGNIPRAYASSFVLELENGDNVAFVVGGTGVQPRSMYEFNPNSRDGRWYEQEGLPASATSFMGGVGHTFNGKGYVFLGGTGTATPGSKQNWSYTPNIEEEDLNDI